MFDIASLLTYWYILPLAIIIATVAMTFGIGGAIFFSPFFLLVLGLPPEMAIALGILIEVFGFTSGLVGYSKNKLVNYHLCSRIIPFAVGAALIGAVIGKTLPSTLLELILASVFFVLAVAFIGKEQKIDYTDHPLHPDIEYEKEKPSWLDFWSDFKKKPLLFGTSSLGGLFVGLVSSGLGEINEYNFIKRLKMHPGISAGSSVFIIALTAISVSILNVSYFAFASSDDLKLLGSIALFAVPGVIIGAQLGVQVARRIDRTKALSVLPLLFGTIGLLTVMNIFL